jgi:hypothetical protein
MPIEPPQPNIRSRTPKLSTLAATTTWRRSTTATPPVHYQIHVKGVLDNRWSAWFHGLQITSDGRQTRIAGPVADQAALHGLLNKIRDLGLELLEVRRTDPD